jgi:hypothetical protein
MSAFGGGVQVRASVCCGFLSFHLLTTPRRHGESIGEVLAVADEATL